MQETQDVRALLARCKRQDRAAFGELFDRYHGLVFRSAFVLTHGREAADDITQLVFLELFTAFRRFDLDRSFLPWLYRIVHNVGVDYLKKHRSAINISASETQLDALIGPDPSPGPAARAEHAEVRHAIWRAMERLSPDQRSVLILCYYADLPERDMATALGVRPGTVKSRLHRARQALRAELSHDRRISPALPTSSVPVSEPAPGSGL